MSPPTTTIEAEYEAARSTSVSTAVGGALLRKLSWTAAGGTSRQLSFFVVNTYLLTCLSSEVFGALTVAFGLLMIFIGIGDFGIRQTGWRRIATDPARTVDIVPVVMATRLLTGTIAFVAYLAIATWFIHMGADWIYFVCYGTGVFVNAITFDFAFLGRDRQDIVGRWSVITFVLYLVLCISSVKGDDTAWLVPVHFLIAMAVLNGVMMWQYRQSVGRLRLRFSIAEMHDLLSESWPLAISFVVVRVTTNYPVLLIGLMLAESDVAAYRTSELFYLFAVQFGLYLGVSVFSRFASLIKEDEQRVSDALSRHIKIAIVIYFPGALLFATLFPVGAAWVVKDHSEAMVIVTYWLAIAMSFGVLTRYLKTCMPSLGLQRELLIVSVASIAVGIGVGAALVSRLGLGGMAMGVCLSESICFLMQLWLIGRRLPSFRIQALVIFAIMIASMLAIPFFLLRFFGLSMPISASIDIALFFSLCLFFRRRRPFLLVSNGILHR